MLPSQYIQSDKDRSRRKKSSHLSTSSTEQQQQQQQQQQQDSSFSSSYYNNYTQSSTTTGNSNANHPHQPPSHPALGITGVICTSRMIDLPNQRGKLHCTIYRPRMLLEQQHSSVATTTNNSTRTTKQQSTPLPPSLPKTPTYNINIPKLPKPNPPLICVAGGPGMSCQYLSGLIHLIPDRAIIIYDHLHCGQSITAAYSSSCSTNHQRTSYNTNKDSNKIKDDVNNTNDDEDDVADGTTTKTTTTSCTFINDTVNDLAILIETIIPMDTSFHLFGHSMGGIIVYEYLKLLLIAASTSDITTTTIAGGQRTCKSCILASTPTNINESYQSKEELIQSIIKELSETGYQKSSRQQLDDDDSDNDETDMDDVNDNDEQQLRQAAHTEFQQRHECRTVPLPLSLQQSLTGLNNSNRRTLTLNMNNPTTIRRRRRRCCHTTDNATIDNGIHPASFNDYIATPLLVNKDDQIHNTPDSTTIPTQKRISFPPVLIIRGQYDFVSETNCRQWEEILYRPNNNNIDDENDHRHSHYYCQYITISNCSHYGFLEEEDLYGNVVLSFLNDHDND